MDRSSSLSAAVPETFTILRVMSWKLWNGTKRLDKHMK